MNKVIENSEILLGRRIRSLRNLKGWTQQELGERADINYKFLGEIERGQQNPSFGVLAKIARSLDLEILELFRFEHETSDRKQIEKRINEILKDISDDSLRQVLILLQALYPVR